MNWISNVVPPKVRSLLRRETPENLWVKCPESRRTRFSQDLEANFFVVPGSGYHMRFAPKARLDNLFDDAAYEEIATPEVPLDPLKFRDVKRYTDRLKEYRLKTGTSDAVKLAFGKLQGMDIVAAVQNFDFLGGSLGLAAGEAIITGMTAAVERRTPFIIFHGLGRRPDAGRHLLADANAAHNDRRAASARRQASLYRRPDQSDDGWRHGLLWHARRYPHRRTRRGHRFCRRKGDRTNDFRERLPEGRSARRILEAHGMIDMVVKEGTCGRRLPAFARC